MASGLAVDAVDIDEVTPAQLKRRVLEMSDFPEPIILPEEMRAADAANAAAVACVEETRNGPRIRVVTADDSVAGDWTIDRAEGEIWSDPPPVPSEGWYVEQVAPVLGF